MCAMGFPRDAPANGGIGAGIDQLLPAGERKREILADSRDLRGERRSIARRLVASGGRKKKEDARVAFNDCHDG